MYINMHISLSLCVCVCVYVYTGRLCILDWGMVIRVPQDLQLSLLEFIANLSAENYEEGMSVQVGVGLFCFLIGLF
jgi:predicted unusual protein kinase regulating ubiquinone biosynthesis (AarF/ABC1/UbiB family)